MKRIREIISLGALGLFVFGISSCYYDKEEYLYPDLTCDTTNVTYSQTIRPIVAANCNVCHTTALAPNGVITETYAGLRAVAKNGKLWGSVSHASGYFPMPLGADQLTACDLSKIKKWINAGSPDN